MHTLMLDSSNPIVRFIMSVRSYRGHDRKSFPSDICALTRVFIYNVIFFSFISSLLGFFLMSAVFFWASLHMILVEPPGVAVIFMSVGAITNAFLLVGCALLGIEWLSGNTNLFDRLSYRIGSVMIMADDFLEKRKKDSALLAMWQAFKTKTCFRVKVIRE